MNTCLVVVVFLFFAGFLSAHAQETPQCGDNEYYSTCASSCPDYCNRKSDTEACIMLCRQKCVCKEGYIRKAYDSDTCVEKSSCDDIPRCPDNQVYRVCDRKLRYCGQPQESGNKKCRIGCGCKQYQVLESKNSNHCVYEAECK